MGVCPDSNSKLKILSQLQNRVKLLGVCPALVALNPTVNIKKWVNTIETREYIPKYSMGIWNAYLLLSFNNFQEILLLLGNVLIVLLTPATQIILGKLS